MGRRRGINEWEGNIWRGGEGKRRKRCYFVSLRYKCVYLAWYTLRSCVMDARSICFLFYSVHFPFCSVPFVSCNVSFLVYSVYFLVCTVPFVRCNVSVFGWTGELWTCLLGWRKRNRGLAKSYDTPYIGMYLSMVHKYLP